MSRSNSVSVYPEATPLRNLSTLELVIVTTLRLWIAAVCGPTQNTAIHWYDGLTAAGLTEQASMAFHELMETVVLSTSGPLDFRPPHCRHLGRDEGRVLQLISLLQHNRKTAAASILSEWMSPTGRRMAGALALRVANGLTQASLTLPSRDGELPGEHRSSPCHTHTAVCSPGTVH